MGQSEAALVTQSKRSRTVKPRLTAWPPLAHLGGDDAVVGVTLRDVGLSSRRGFFMPDVHRPTVHPDLLPHTLMERERERERCTGDINRNTGGG